MKTTNLQNPQTLSSDRCGFPKQDPPIWPDHSGPLKIPGRRLIGWPPEPKRWGRWIAWPHGPKLWISSESLNFLQTVTAERTLRLGTWRSNPFNSLLISFLVFFTVFMYFFFCSSVPNSIIIWWHSSRLVKAASHLALLFWRRVFRTYVSCSWRSKSHPSQEPQPRRMN